jgi:hypothetical protein
VSHDRPIVGWVDLASPGTPVAQRLPAATQVTAVSPTLSEAAAQLRGDAHCSTMVDLDLRTRLWQSCAWHPVEFSPDGSRVLAVDVATDGLGVRDLAVLNAANGDIVQEYVTPGAFGRATFEDGPDTIVAVLLVHDQEAIVRCDVEGACALATPPATVTPDDPDSLVRPYQLTAN